ncbi:hypothetical protein [Clostridium perfringens]|uniref:hypothetical protein n=1 Tax=Clostridium perfringens TaxID=1502 RepID=UPI0018E46BBC|nr:hypothetical protein [Clostridium perfringens]MBI6035253.1 hypothetical protein [Clostridium perfringens]MDK0598172.1 hypothetical protein [Clostridium perfringens]MDK0942130.1 hypothetical protein [Clostridium perfringens]MDK0945508.1 hypothetical protein [Clostridium perfringens]MDM0651206.1 hypothetical protein [Clostridium perfringens]
MHNNNLKLQSFLKNSISDNLNVLKKRESILNSLLSAKSYKYGVAYKQTQRKKFFNLNDSCGIYHFYYIKDNIKYSLYVGKAGFGKSGKRNLSQRLNQHFQPTQEETIHGKVNEKLGFNNINTAIQFLCSEEVYVQFLEIYKKSNIQNLTYNQVDDEIKVYEKFCIDILKPIFTDK